MRRRASPVTKISVSTTEISATGMKIFPYEHSSPVTGMKFKKQNQNGATLTSIVRDYHSFADSCNFTNKANSNTFEVEMHTRQNYAILAAQFRKRS